MTGSGLMLLTNFKCTFWNACLRRSFAILSPACKNVITEVTAVAGYEDTHHIQSISSIVCSIQLSLNSIAQQNNWQKPVFSETSQHNVGTRKPTNENDARPPGGVQ